MKLKRLENKRNNEIKLAKSLKNRLQLKNKMSSQGPTLRCPTT